MRQPVKHLLQRLHVYHPLQTSYRSVISFVASQYYKLSYRKYRGKGFTCNFCGAVYEQFIPEHPSPDIEHAIYDNNVIAGFGENVYCPRCMSRNRDRLVKAVIKHYLTIDNKKVLHFSPEKKLFQFLSAAASVTTVDILPGFYRHIDKNILQADATSLPFADNSYDLIIANHILEHIPDDGAAMREMHRVLKKGGVAILQAPWSMTLSHTLEDGTINDPVRQAALYGQKDHVRIYAWQDYLRRLRAAGFQIRILSPADLGQFRDFAIQEGESCVLCSK